VRSRKVDAVTKKHNVPRGGRLYAKFALSDLPSHVCAWSFTLVLLCFEQFATNVGFEGLEEDFLHRRPIC
jgi:hypothetical protein